MYNILRNDEYPLEEIGGPLTEPLGNYTPYNFRAIINYCEERGVLPKDLSDEERDLFEIKSYNAQKMIKDCCYINEENDCDYLLYVSGAVSDVHANAIYCTTNGVLVDSLSEELL